MSKDEAGAQVKSLPQDPGELNRLREIAYETIKTFSSLVSYFRRDAFHIEQIQKDPSSLAINQKMRNADAESVDLTFPFGPMSRYELLHAYLPKPDQRRIDKLLTEIRVRGAKIEAVAKAMQETVLPANKNWAQAEAKLPAAKRREMRFAAAQLIADKAHAKDIEWIANALQTASVLFQRLEARIIAAVETKVDRTAIEDGPDEPFRFWLNGKPYELPEFQYYALKSVWPDRSMPLNEFVQAYRSDPNYDPTPGGNAVGGMIQRLNIVLSTAKYTRKLKQRAGLVIWNKPLAQK